jgi:hypothetical protein
MAPRAPTKRNYKKEYANYQGKPAQKVNRAKRNAARTIAKKNGAKVAGKDVAHKNGNPRDNRPNNLAVKTPAQNRSYARTRTARKRNPYA